MADTGSTWGRRLIWIAAFVVAFAAAFYGVKALKRHWFDKRTDAAMVAASERKLADIRERAMKEDPEAPVSDAMQKEAARQMTTAIESQAGDKARQARTAADQFWGFLLVNTRSRVDFCKELGVDISPFREAFESVHRDEIARATAIYAQQGMDKERVYQPLKAQMRGSTEQDMRDFAKAANTDLPGACKIVAENAQDLASEFRLSKRLPAVHRALMGTP